MGAVDWLSRLFQMMPVSGRLDLRCSYGAPWRIDQGAGKIGEIPYHAIVAGSAVLDAPGEGGRALQLKAGDILLLPGNPRHVLHDGSNKRLTPTLNRSNNGIMISENIGVGERLDMLCGHFVVRPPYDRLLLSYLPPRLVVHASAHDARGGSDTAVELANLVTWMRSEATRNQLGGVAILNALSTALFALALRLASEANDPPVGLLGVAGRSRLAPALTALIDEPSRSWSLPELARACNMSRATFVRQFKEKLGRSASDLLTDLRMALAANELKKPSMSTGAVANTVGYQSEAAFQRAFKSHTGVTPAQWRKMQALPEPRMDVEPPLTSEDSNESTQAL